MAKKQSPSKNALKERRGSKPRPATGDLSLRRLADNIDLPASLVKELARSGFQTLDDLRRDPTWITRLSPKAKHEKSSLDRLEAHARLSVLGVPVETSDRLARSGFSGPVEIADLTAVRFVERTRRRLDEASARDVHRRAQSVVRLLDDAAVAARTYPKTSTKGKDDGKGDYDGSCSCRDCDAAVSQRAYLLDLLDYALSNLELEASSPGAQAQSIDLNWLERNFYFTCAEISDSCEVAQESLLQVRLCVEVLRRAAVGAPGSIGHMLERAELESLRAAYEGLLSEHGVARSELSAARGHTAAERELLAQRLGFELVAGGVDRLEQLYLEDSELTEARLEELFGWRPTTAAPDAPSIEGRIVSWRRSYLREQWKELDYPSDNSVSALTPVLDPDLLNVGHFLEPSSGSTELALFVSRHQQLDLWRETLASDRLAATSPDVWLESAFSSLGFAAGEMATLDAARRNNEDVRGRLTELGLRTSAFARLVWALDYLERGGTLSSSGWQEIDDILLGARKRQHYDAWRQEERSIGVSLSPLLFGPDPFDVEINPWLLDFETVERQRSRLEARRAQLSSLNEAAMRANRAAEERALPILRDTLVRVVYRNLVPESASVGADPRAHTTDRQLSFLTRRLQIDVALAPCHEVTRIEQCISTVQGIIWAVRAGLLPRTPLKLAADDLARGFDSDWRWLGSYASWRAAMMVHLYPENLLLPSLRRRQTPGFEAMVRASRASGRVTPDMANQLADTYSSYFADVCRLDLLTSAPFAKGTGNTTSERVLCIGRGGDSGRLYWSLFDQADGSSASQTYWAPVPQLEEVTHVDSAELLRFEGYGGDTRLILVVKTASNGGPALRFHTFLLPGGDILEPAWSTREPTDVDVALEGGWTLLPCLASNHAPVGILLWGAARRQFLQLNRDGTDFEPPVRGEGYASVEGTDDFAYYEDANGDKQSLSSVRPLAVASVYREFLVGTGDYWRFILLAHDASSKKILAIEVRDLIAGFQGTLEQDWPFEDSADWGTAFLNRQHSQLVYIYRRPSGHRYRSIDFRLGQADSIGQSLTGSLPISGQAKFGSIAVAEGERCYVPFEHANETPRSAERLLLALDVRADGKVSTHDGVSGAKTRVAPQTGDFVVRTSDLASLTSWLQSQIQIAVEANPTGSVNEQFLDYLDEAYYYVPVHLALALRTNGFFLESLAWLRTVFDEREPAYRRFRYLRLGDEAYAAPSFSRFADWLSDPLDLHAVAAVRSGVDERYLILSMVCLLLDYADHEFSQGGHEGLVVARNLYLHAQTLLESPWLDQGVDNCAARIGSLEIQVGQGALATEWVALVASLHDLHSVEAVATTTQALEELWGQNSESLEQVVAGRRLVEAAVASDPEPVRSVAEARALTTEARARTRYDTLGQLESGSILNPSWTSNQGSGLAVGETSPEFPYAPSINITFCIPPNPLINVYRQRAELGLYKLRQCRDIAGLESESVSALDSVALDDALPALSTSTSHGAISTVAVQPTQYRYAALIERARQLTGLAQQAEGALLAALEKRDQEVLGRLRALHEARGARGSVRIQRLRLSEASTQLQITRLQTDRARIQTSHYSDLIENGWLGEELWAVGLLWTAMGFQFAVAALKTAGAVVAGAAAGSKAAGAGAAPGAVAGAAAAAAIDPAGAVLSSVAGGLSTWSSALSMTASFRRREQDWKLQRALSEQDVLIGRSQIESAQRRLRISDEEFRLAEVQSRHSEDVVEFLHTKFTRAELYEWMSQVFEANYRYFLQQATALARLAESQLAFERQQPPLGIVQSDYWSRASSGNSATGAQSGGDNDNRGITGSASLLRDLEQVDLHAFETAQRKLQMTKTLSLARLDPFAFQRFRQTGVLDFRTTLELFDRDYPGHYLRLIKRLSVSVVALVPPTSGVKASLTSGGTSRVVVGGTFETVNLNRGAESIALSSGRNESGVFELEMQRASDLLLPFEGMGVDASWRLVMPKAANFFDYRTVADVLLTMDYTALESQIYRAQVIESLSSEVGADRPFSLRHQLPEAWYDLHNPDQTSSPLRVEFPITHNDFPPNLSQIRIEELVLHIATKEDVSFTSNVDLRLTPAGGSALGGQASPQQGTISTRQGGATAWIPMVGQAPYGVWTLALDDTPTVRDSFENEELEDILLVISYRASTEAWPA